LMTIHDDMLRCRDFQMKLDYVGHMWLKRITNIGLRMSSKA